jgi:hypothetical protein
MHTIREDFRGELNPALSRLEIGTGRVEHTSQGVRLVTDPTDNAQPGQPYRQYSDAQLYDYAHMARRDFPCNPPLRMTVRAWASHSTAELVGTAGFGFWNQPVMPGQALPRLPRAVWFFFGSPPSNMAFAQDVSGHGWKAATIDASRLPFLLLAPTAPLGFLLMRKPTLYRHLWPVAQRAMGVSEKSLDLDLREPHTYLLDWLPRTARFFVDGTLIHETPYAPHGPLGFVTWLDNQYAIITPQGQIQMGLLPIPQRQWLALESLVIEPL